MVLIMPRSRPPYPEEFRREAVELVRGGRSIKDVAQSLGCSEQTLHVWVKRYQLDHMERDDGLRSDEREELRLLRRKVRRLEEEKEILKRATALFVREPETR
jgi:transposase